MTTVVIGIGRSITQYVHLDKTLDSFKKMGHCDLVLRSSRSKMSLGLDFRLHNFSSTILRKAKTSQNKHLLTAFDSLGNMSS